MSINSHHPVWCATLWELASQSATEWGQNDSPLPNRAVGVPTSWLQSNHCPTKADSTMTTMTGFGRPKVEPCRKPKFPCCCWKIESCNCARTWHVILRMESWWKVKNRYTIHISCKYIHDIMIYVDIMIYIDMMQLGIVLPSCWPGRWKTQPA